MRKIKLLTFISLDGVMQGPGGLKEDLSNGFTLGGWTVPYFDEESGQYMSEQMSLKERELLLGRKTYDIFASYWPQNSDGWPGINEVNKYVVSHNTGMQFTWQNSILISGNVVEKIKELKSSAGPDLCVWGSGELTQTLLSNDLVDEMSLKIFPITLGSGKKLFGNGTIAKAFKLTESKVTKSGVIFANYEKTGEVKTGSF